MGIIFSLMASGRISAAEIPSGDAKEITIPFSNLKSGTRQPSIGDFNLSQGKRLNFTIKVDGKDFDENKSQGCYAVSPWFDLERQLFKTKKGFEVRDKIELKKNVRSSEIQDSQEYKYFLKDLDSCFRAQRISLKKLDPKQSLKLRLAQYTLGNIKALRDIPGRAGAGNALKIKMIADQLLEKNLSNKEFIVERVKALRFMGYRPDETHGATHLVYIDAALDKVLAQDPNYIPALIQKSYNLVRMKQIEQARTYFLKAYSFEKARNHELFILGGWLSKQMKKTNSAMRFYTHSLALAKSNYEKSLSYKRMGYIADDRLEQKKAGEYFLKALQYDPSDTVLMNEVLALSIDTRNFNQAIKIGEKLLTLEDSSQARQNLAHAYAGNAENEMAGLPSAEKIQRARAFVMQGLKWDAKNTLCNQALARYNLSLTKIAKNSSNPVKSKIPDRQPASSPK